MKRYKHPYGGVCTTIGEFTPSELFKYLGSIGKSEVAESLKRNLHMSNCPEKVLDIVLPDNRELLAYSTTTGYVRLELINH